MVGQNQIIEARKDGKKPAAIFIEAGFRPLVSRFAFDDPEQALAHMLYPVVTIPPEEMTAKQDFRFCVGCSVHVHGLAWSDEIFDIADKVVQAGAARVIVCCINDNNDILEWKNGGWNAHAD